MGNSAMVSHNQRDIKTSGSPFEEQDIYETHIRLPRLGDLHQAEEPP